MLNQQGLSFRLSMLIDFLCYNAYMATELTLTMYDQTFVFVDKSLKQLAKLAIAELSKENTSLATDAIKKLKKNQFFFVLAFGQIRCSIIESK